MPSPTTGLTLIEDALGLTNAVGSDQTLTADEVSDCLRKLNDLIEDWNTQDLAVYGSSNQTFNTIANQQVYTIGAGGDFNTVLPVRIDGAYTTISGTSFPCTPITQEQFDAIPVKGQTLQYPIFFLFVKEFPLGLITLWPIPDQVYPMTFQIDRVLGPIAAAGTTISFPQGYANAFVYNLAILVGPLFGKKMKDYPDLVGLANTSLGNIKRANKTANIMQFDAALTSGRRRPTWQSGY